VLATVGEHMEAKEATIAAAVPRSYNPEVIFAADSLQMAKGVIIDTILDCSLQLASLAISK
jgi:hypothetical protein